MKILIGLVMFVIMGALAQAQTPPTPPMPMPMPMPQAKVIAEISGNKGVKNSPFSADAVSESVQILADGNRIVRSSTSRMYRNSEGRFRQEITGGTGGMLGSTFTIGQGITILDPVAGQRYLLDSILKTARVGTLMVAPDRKMIDDNAKLVLAEKAVAVERMKADVDKLKAELKAMPPVAVVSPREGQVVTGVIASTQGGSLVYAPGVQKKYESRTEELGTQNIEGVDAEGKRTITTIPAGAIGNERPIEIVYENWYSKELQLVVASRHIDPRFGEQTYRLTNINRSEPDPSLFEVPNGYKVMAEPASAYKLASTKAIEAEKAAMVKAAQSGTTFKKTKP